MRRLLDDLGATREQLEITNRGHVDECRLWTVSTGSSCQHHCAYSPTVDNAKVGDYGLRIGLAWWFLGMLMFQPRIPSVGF